MNFKKVFILTICSVLLSMHSCDTGKIEKTDADSPRIVNIINFIRLLEPRDAAITEDVLFETVHQQIHQLNDYNLPATFLLQYDALINRKYQDLLKSELSADSEIGAWWEITQPHVEDAGMQWRGKYPWDWHANVGFATGYTPEEREQLVDVYMDKFKSVFGKYPASVGSWFIDAHTLQYMYDKYGIIASCNCKDQVGTDGYTLWGGYWNQAYYPSKINAYMPAQTEAGQIPVPIFRMLGSDPIYQYNMGLGGRVQGVESLEPVYPRSGGNRKWVESFFKNMLEGSCLAFNYVQAGQENSFTWDAMKTGLEIQIPLLDSLRRDNKIRVETLSESGKWFKENFPTTPATAVTAMDDVRNEGHKTVWFNSRFYRANLLWKDQNFRFRDIHLFSEKLESDYFTKAGESTQCIYKTLPVVDGFLWSTREYLAGLKIVKKGVDGMMSEVLLNAPVVDEPEKGMLSVKCLDDAGNLFIISFREDKFEVSCEAKEKDLSWMLEMRAAPNATLPFQVIAEKEIKASQDGFEYTIVAEQGTFDREDGAAFRIMPSDNVIVINCNTAR